MKKALIVLSCIFAFTALALWLPDAEAYFDFGSCAGCHASVADMGPGHGAHAALAGSVCSECHATATNNPPLADCMQCHGRAEDAGGGPGLGLGDGLRAHHNGKGISCSGCHSADTTPAAEHTMPSLYASVGLNPCNGSEEAFTSLTVSLDNDGDGLTDAADPDCGWQSIAGYLDAYIQSQYVAGPDVLGLGDGDNEYGFIYDPQAYKNTVDNDGGLPGDGTICGVGDDMANRPVLVDNLMGTNTLIPGTSIRNVWNNASTAYGGMSNTVISALRNKVIAHREAGFSDDIAVY